MPRVVLVAVFPLLVQGALRLHTPKEVAKPSVQAALPAPSKDAPLASKAKGQVQFTVEQKKHMHFGCVEACKPSPVESKCVTACEAASYKCIDETGPMETPKDTAACQGKVLEHYKATKGIEKKEEKKAEKKDAKGDKKEEKKGEKKEAKKEEKKAKMFLQLTRNIDDENAEAAEMARLEAESDKDLGEDDDDSSKSDDDDGESFVQVSRNIDDENAEAAEMARLEAESDKDLGEDDDGDSGSNTASDDEEGESFVQVARNIDDENAEAAEMARLEAESDKDLGEDDDDTSKSGDDQDDE